MRPSVITPFPAKVVLFAAALALLVRLFIVASEGGVTTRFSEVSEVRGYHELALNLAERGVYGYGGNPTAFTPPLYPMFLAAIYRITGNSIRAARLAQSFVFLALLPILYFLGARLVGGSGASAACVLAALYPIFAHYSIELLSESLAIVLVPLGLLTFLWLDESPGAARGAVVGLAIAAALLIRPLFLAPALGMAALVANGSENPAPKTDRWRAVSALAAVVILTLLPWVIRNGAVFGAFIPFGTYGGYALYDGATEYRTSDWNARKEQFRAELGIHRSDFERADPERLPDEVALDRKARELALAEIRGRPGRYLSTLLSHAEVTLIGLHESDLQGIGTGRIPLALGAGTIPYWLVLGAALAWLVPRLRSLSRPSRSVLVLALVGVLATLPFSGAIRYRVPLLDPLLLIFAGAWIAGRLERARGPAPREVGDARAKEPDSRLVSVVIPMRNEAAHIGACLESLARQDIPADRFEVIVVDGDSSDGSAAIVGDTAARFSNIRLCRNPRLTTPFGLNTGIRESRGDVIVILGAHAWVAPDFVRENLAALDSSGADAVGGAMEAIGQEPFARAVASAVSSRFGVGAIAFRQGSFEGFVDTAAFAAYRRDVFERIGLFDEELVRNQDDELNYRLRKQGGKIFLSPRIRTRYVSRASAWSLWRQYFAYGLWKVRVLQKHPSTMRPRHFVPPLSIGFGALSLALAIIEPRALWVAGGLAAAYAVGVVAAAARLSASLGGASFPRLIVVFPILHFSYGSGFLLGLVRFLPRWWIRETPPPFLTRS